MTHPVPDSVSHGDDTPQTVGQEQTPADRRAVDGGKPCIRWADEHADPDPGDTVGHHTVGEGRPRKL